MTSPAQCAFCFEVLSASLEKRAALSLYVVEDLWAQFEAADEEDVTDEPHQNPALAVLGNRLAVSTPSTSSSNSASAASSTPSVNTTASSATSLSSRSPLDRLRGEKREEFPLFVTWDKISARGKSLRGCIGTFEPHELDDGLRSYALTSALDDTRFNPVSARELPSLECSVTLLTDFEPAADAMDWEIGKHGLRISFTYHGRRFGATYLPDVAKEQGWTKEETLVSLMRKAGWGGRSSEWSKVNLQVIRYQGRKASLDYKTWREWRDWVEETGRD
ncbi:hypothetical protein EJ06DRAFT_582679 [Trichodelitschia bisporula]|uniref:AMMECR1 domain-containing protein n=1 Tax=Trichodelitschia bisporula TaxID=703511 RepID=A0A6G1HWL2_9PEZI|nr:hypothetical protein EJ06DRAFT_582679 [Trichodelitschia bisporula]